MIGYILIIAGIACIVYGAILIKQNADQNKVTKADNIANLGLNGSSNTLKAVAKKDSTQVEPQTIQTFTYEEKGNLFERYVVDHFELQERKYFSLIDWQSDKFSNGVYPESNRFPDIIMELKSKGMIYPFAIECKYRKAFKNDSLQWATPEKIEIYKNFSEDNDTPVFVALGIGGEPNAPEDIYIVPLEHMLEPVISRFNIEIYKTYNPNGLFDYSAEKKNLYMKKRPQ